MRIIHGQFSYHTPTSDYSVNLPSSVTEGAEKNFICHQSKSYSGSEMAFICIQIGIKLEFDTEHCV